MSSNKILSGIIVLLVVVLGVGTYILFSKTPTTDGYSAVFLTNGQVYFGNIVEQKRGTIVLENIYYLQTNTADPQAEVTEANMSLVKLGNELHGPTDEMQINRDHVLFTETLRDDSKVVQAITSQQP
jgi:hypothetical protein